MLVHVASLGLAIFVCCKYLWTSERDDDADDNKLTPVLNQTPPPVLLYLFVALTYVLINYIVNRKSHQTPTNNSEQEEEEREQSVSTMDADQAYQDKLPLFQFIRIKCAKSKRPVEEPIGAAAAAAADVVSPFTPGVPGRRSGHRAVCTEDYMYIWGGYCPPAELEASADSSPLFPELWRLNLATRGWDMVATTGDAPVKTVASHSAILYKNSMIVFGGTGFPFGDDLTNDMYVLNLSTFEWKKHEIFGNAPMKLYGSSIAIIDHYLYVLCGTCVAWYCSNVYRINMKTMESEVLFDSVAMLRDSSPRQLQDYESTYPESFLNGRYRQEAVLYNNKFWLFGGGDENGDSCSLKLLPAFDLATKKWQFVETSCDGSPDSFPQKRKFHSAFLIADDVYIFGGLHTTADQQMTPAENCVWKLSMSDMRWSRLDIKMPVHTHFHASCMNNSGDIYFHGGISRSRDNAVYRTNLTFKLSTRIPKLSEMSWSRLVASYPRLLETSTEQLRELGVPLHFAKRVN